MEPRDADPWNWTIDEVVHEFCQSRTIWLERRPNGAFPDPSRLERLLRANDVDGPTMLTDIGQSELKEDFQIQSIGQRGACIWLIDQLRQKSAKWRENCQANALMHSQILSLPGPQITNHGHSPSLPPEGDADTRLYKQTDRELSETKPPGQEPTTNIYPKDADNGHNSPTRDDSSDKGVSAHRSKSPIRINNDPNEEHRASEHSSDDHVPGKRRSGETLVEDNQGRKRRRLTLVQTATSCRPVAIPSEVPEQAGSQDWVSLPSRSALSGTKSSVATFLGPNKLSPETVFFGSGKIGEWINDEWNPPPAHENSTPLSNFEVVLHRDLSFSGRQGYVKSQLQRYFNSASRVELGSSDAVVVHPYPPASNIAETSRSVMLFKWTGSGVVATRERASRFGKSLEPETDSAPSNHDWDFLDHWRTEDGASAELPAYGASENDSDWNRCVESIEAEEEAEKQDLQKSSREIDRSKVLDVIDEEITNFTKRWETEKLPLRNNKAWTIWRKARHPKERFEWATQARMETVQLRKRLDKLTTSITDEVWYNTPKLRIICKSLQETVYQREEAKFRASVWQCPDAPPRPATELRTRKKKRSIHDSDEDGIMLNSDSDVVDDIESQDDFVDIDMDTVQHVDMINEIGSPQALEIEQQDISEIESNSQSRVMKPEQETVSDSNSHNGVAQPQQKDVLDSRGEDQPEPDRIIALETCLPSSVSDPTPHPEIIDLTFSDDDEAVDDIQRPVLPAERPQSSHSSATGRFGPDPFEDSETQIRDITFEELEERNDTKRIILKLLRALPIDVYANLRQHFIDEGHRISDAMFHAADALMNREPYGKHLVMQALRLYCCWLDCSPRLFKNSKVRGKWQFTELEIPHEKARELYGALETKSGIQDVRDFCKFLREVFERYPVPVEDSGAIQKDDTEGKRTADNSNEDSENEEAGSANTPHKKRKRVVAESQVGKDKRTRALKLREQHEERGRIFLTTQSSELAETADGIVVNIGKHRDQAVICLNHHIGRRIKPHQVEGVRFMWREIVSNSTEDKDNMQGCLLAHTMGLGKTMQAIALIATIAEASSSPDEAIRSQVPESLRKSRTLLILPAALISNWLDEFRLWLPSSSAEFVGHVRSIRAEMSVKERLSTIKEWYKRGGVLLISYQLLRMFVDNRGTSKTAPKLTDEEHDRVEKWLLNGPNLIIADEAHYVKNIDSKIGKVVTRFRSNSKIALTGSPLNNNLLEYFAMINWIAPGYLGDRTEFKARYVEPISEGLYVTSTAPERSKSRRQLKMLEKLLGPKIHRRDVTVLKGSLKPKVEFAITLPLTHAQEQAYKVTIESIQGGGMDIIDNARLWAWMGMLRLLCNHPILFLKKMKEKAEATSSKVHNQDAHQISTRVLSTSEVGAEGAAEVVGDEQEINGADALPSEISGGLLAKITQILDPLLKTKEPHSAGSYKVKLFLQLVKKCQVIGDNILVFSHSIPTLDFLEKVLGKTKCKYARLDGQTKINGRQDMMKKFNEGAYDVFLISTRAGGLGYNLPGANRVILFDFHWNPTWEEQAIGRAYRLGQEKPVFVYRFCIGGTFEEELLNNAVFKIQLAYRVVEKKNIKSRAEKANKWLAIPRTVAQEDLDEHQGKDSALDRILAEHIAHSDQWIRAIKTTETLQQEDDELLTPEDLLDIEREYPQEKLRIENPERFKQAEAQAQDALLRTRFASDGIYSTFGIANMGNMPSSSLADPRRHQAIFQFPSAPTSTAPASTAPASTAPASTAPAATAPASTAPMAHGQSSGTRKQSTEQETLLRTKRSDFGATMSNLPEWKDILH